MAGRPKRAKGASGAFWEGGGVHRLTLRRVQTSGMGRFGDALVEDADVERAAERALLAALDSLGGATPDLTAVFVCGDSDDAAAAALRQVAAGSGSSTVLGCNASG